DLKSQIDQIRDALKQDTVDDPVVAKNYSRLVDRIYGGNHRFAQSVKGYSEKLGGKATEQEVVSSYAAMTGHYQEVVKTQPELAKEVESELENISKKCNHLATVLRQNKPAEQEKKEVLESYTQYIDRYTKAIHPSKPKTQASSSENKPENTQK